MPSRDLSYDKDVKELLIDNNIMLREELIKIALQWQERFGVAPSITSAISEYDAAMLVGMSESEYSDYMKDKTAVSKGSDFVFQNIRYQVKGNRPSGKKGSIVTKVPKASNYEWDRFIWILYAIYNARGMGMGCRRLQIGI